MVRFNIAMSNELRKKFFMIGSSLWGIINKEKKPNATEEVVHNVALATIALTDGDIEKSGNMLLKTLNFAETNNLPGAVISACDLLSSLAIKVGDYARAENLLLKALNNLISLGASDDNNYVMSFNIKLSRLYSSNGNDDLAELGFKNCLKIQGNKLKYYLDEETRFLRTTTLYWYGKFLLGKKRFQEAKSCFQECYLSSLEVESILQKQIMVILYNLGEVCVLLGDHDEATENLLKGVSLDKKCANPDLTYFYSKLGAIFMLKGLYKEAELWCDKAQKTAVKYKIADAERESNECLEKINSLFSK